MDNTNQVVSIGKSIQSMGTKAICILLVNDDLTCSNIVTEMLQHCSYEVLHIGGVFDVLHAIWETKDRLDLVLTNAHKLESNGIEIVEHIQKKFNLPTILMCPDKMKIVSKDRRFSCATYVLKGLSKRDVNNLWQFALEKEKDKMVATYQEENAERPSTSNIVAETKSRESKEQNVKNEGSKEDSPPAKKPRVVWTIEMHQKFIEAIESIGYDNAVPKKILEIMDIPGLTRENIASHLQKFRGSMKRTQEAALSSLSVSSNTTKEFEGSYILPLPFASRLNFMQRNARTPLVQNSYISFAKESISTTSESQCLNTCNKFSFGTKNYKNIGDLGFGGMQQKYVPKIPQQMTKNMFPNLGIDDNQSRSGKFVGYRLMSDGKSIQFGKSEASDCNNKNDGEMQVSQQDPPLISTGRISQEPSLLGSRSGETSSQCQSVLGFENPTNKFITMSVNASSKELIENLARSPPTPLENFSENTQRHFSLLDQNTSMQSVETFPNDIVSTVQINASTPSPSIFPSDQNFLETPGNEFPLQNSMAGLESISGQHYSLTTSPYFDDFLEHEGIDDDLLKGTGSTSHQFDWEEFDDTVFKHDD